MFNQLIIYTTKILCWFKPFEKYSSTNQPSVFDPVCLSAIEENYLGDGLRRQWILNPNGSLTRHALIPIRQAAMPQVMANGHSIGFMGKFRIFRKFMKM